MYSSGHGNYPRNFADDILNISLLRSCIYSRIVLISYMYAMMKTNDILRIVPDKQTRNRGKLYSYIYQCQFREGKTY